MPSCVISNCKNNSCFEKKSSGITFHKFPGDEKWKDEWIRAVRVNREDKQWVPSKFSVVCSLHFEDTDIYDTISGYRRIRKNATPKKLHLVNSEWCQDITSAAINPTPGLDTMDDNVKEDVEEAPNSGFSSDKLTENSDSELESLFDTPRKYKLRKEARKYKLLYKTQLRKIKTLYQKVKRLKKRNASLKNIIKDLKEKRYTGSKKIPVRSKERVDRSPTLSKK